MQVLVFTVFYAAPGGGVVGIKKAPAKGEAGASA
jgi:hypothetical protein